MSNTTFQLSTYSQKYTYSTFRGCNDALLAISPPLHGYIISMQYCTCTVQGYVEVRLCPNNNVDQDPDQDCFDRPGAALEVAGTGQVHI